MRFSVYPIENRNLVYSGLLKKHLKSMSSKLEPEIWSRDTDQRIPCFGKCQLTITKISKYQVACLCRPISWSTVAILGYSTVAVVRARPRAVLLAMITMKKSIHRFPLHVSMRLRLVTIETPELRFVVYFQQDPVPLLSLLEQLPELCTASASNGMRCQKVLKMAIS